MFPWRRQHPAGRHCVDRRFIYTRHISYLRRQRDPWKEVRKPLSGCNTGHLEPVWRTVVVGKSTSGVIGMSMTGEVIDRLGCNGCGASYEADGRGKMRSDILGPQLKGAGTGGEPLSAYPDCAGSLEERQDIRYPSLPTTPSPMPLARRTYRFCPTRLTIAWVGPWDRDPDAEDARRWSWMDSF